MVRNDKNGDENGHEGDVGPDVVVVEVRPGQDGEDTTGRKEQA